MRSSGISGRKKVTALSKDKTTDAFVYEGVNESLAGKLRRITKANRFFAEIALWLIIADFVFVIFNIVMRRFFNMPVFGATEVIRYGMLFCASFAIIENEWVDGNVSMLLFLEKMTHKTRQFVLFIMNAFSTFGVGFVAYLMIMQAIQRVADHQATPALNFPIWIPAACIAFGFVLLTVVLGIKTCVYYWMAKTGQTFVFRRLAIINTDPLSGKA